MSDTDQQTLSIPSLLAFAVVSFLAIRWFFFSGPSATASGSSSHAPGSQRARRRPFPAERVDQLAAMFPQLSRRDIEWDLVQNGGSVQATTERVLTGGRLPPAPPNFTAGYAAPPVPVAAPSTSTQQQRGKQSHQDLITRYGLSSRVGEAAVTGSEEGQEAQKDKGGWSSSKTERQALLKRRRDEMILEARRKLQERERKGKGPA